MSHNSMYKDLFIGSINVSKSNISISTWEKKDPYRKDKEKFAWDFK